MKAVWWALVLASLVVVSTLGALIANSRAGLTPLGLGLLLGLGALTAGWPLVRLLRPRPLETAPSPEAELVASSPRAWIHDDVWRQRRQAARFGDLGVSTDTTLGAHAVLVPVSDQERSAPIGTERPALVPASSFEQARVALANSPDIGAIWNTLAWPWCCDRIAVLTLVNPTPAELSAWEKRAVSADALDGLPLAALRAGEPHEVGTNVFQCSACGRVYARITHT